MKFQNLETGEIYEVTLISDSPTPDTKVAFVIGHHENAQGAYSPILKETEWAFWQRVYGTELSNLGDIFLHNKNNPSYTGRQQEMAERTKDYDLVFELHFNMFDGNANGCETLYWHSNDRAKATSALLCDTIEEEIGINARRNIAVVDSHINGGGFIVEQKTTAILFEGFFGDSEKDVNSAQLNGNKFKKIMAQVIAEF